MSTDSYDRWKRSIDLVFALLGLLITAPLQAVIAIAVRKDLGSPILFRQVRPGKDARLFTLVKFRTMRSTSLDEGLVTDAQRLTRLGSFLRASSLDELPTLWNVVRGEMSLVGPRPLLVEYLPRYSPEQRRRHEVRPGITGLAQINGRNAISWAQKFNLDIEYVDHRSLKLDLCIVLGTFGAVARRRGISDSIGPTMTHFRGDMD